MTDLLAEARRRLAAIPGASTSPRSTARTRAAAPSRLYLTAAGVPFDRPRAARRSTTTPPSRLATSIQHGIYKGFIAPVVLYVAIGFAVSEERPGRKARGEDSHEPRHARPVGGKLITPFFNLLALVALVGAAALVVYRFGQGLGAVSGMTDGYAWGIWMPSTWWCSPARRGGYAVGLLVYVLNKGKYHPLVRPAVLVGALGYTLGGTSIMVDLGRYWGSVFLFYPPWCNFNSVLLEVALCVMTYVVVLWVEVSPAVLERWRAAGLAEAAAVRRVGRPEARTRRCPSSSPSAILLPTMHQSSLGALMMAPTKMHPLWFTRLAAAPLPRSPASSWATAR